jgi:hypothetical protein
MQLPYQKHKSSSSLHLAAWGFFPVEPKIPIVRAGTLAATLQLQKSAKSRHK